MPSTRSDRIDGISTSVAVKAPVRLATTANITLSAEQSIDGFTTSADRVLVKDQTDPVENGIYLSGTGAWVREPDFDGARDVVNGTQVFVNEGSTQAGTYWKFSSTDDPIRIGTSEVTVSAIFPGVSDPGLVSFTAVDAAADIMPYTTDANVWAALTTTAIGRSLLAAANAAALRTILSLGTAAVLNSGTTNGTIPLIGAGDVLAAAVLPAATTSAIGAVEKAIGSEMYAETADKYPDAAILRNHPGVAKGWANVTVGGVLTKGYGVTSVTDTAAGDWTVNWSFTMADANYVANATVENSGADFKDIIVRAKTTTTTRINTVSAVPALSESGVTNFHLVIHGQLA